MTRHQTATVLDVLLGQLSRCLAAESARQVVEIRIDPAVRSRIEALAEREGEDLLTDEERTEYKTLVNASDFVTALQNMARRHLSTDIGRE
ncbi:MAG: hypothetical protein WKF75_10020 [Singulisphaera sp.]